jgi:hypothetical protein
LAVAKQAVALGETAHRRVGRAHLALARGLLLRGGIEARADVEDALARAEADAERGGMALLAAEIGPNPDARYVARLTLGLSSQALAEFAA